MCRKNGVEDAAGGRLKKVYRISLGGMWGDEVFPRLGSWNDWAWAHLSGVVLLTDGEDWAIHCLLHAFWGVQHDGARGILAQTYVLLQFHVIRDTRVLNILHLRVHVSFGYELGAKVR